MNKNRILRFIIIMIFVLVALVLSGCAVLKKDKTTDTTTIEKLDITKKSVDTIKTSEAIRDRIVINVPKTDNTELLRMFDSMMRQMNISKTSGTNSYQSKYDEKTRQWIIEFMMAKTENSKSVSESEIISDKSFEQNIDEYIKKMVVPWWMYVVLIFLSWPYIEKVVTLFVPGFNLINLLKRRK